MISNNRLKYYVDLKKRKYREKEQKFIVEGLRLCEELLASDFEIEELVYCPSILTPNRARDLINKFKAINTPTQEVSKATFGRISDTRNSQGILVLVKKKEYDLTALTTQTRVRLLALDDLNDPGNLGTIIRTALWFGFSGVLLGNETVDHTNPKVVRSSMGAIFHLPVFPRVDLEETARKLKNDEFAIYATQVSGGVAACHVAYPRRMVLIIGHEITGVRRPLRDLATEMISIQRTGRGESLNVAIASGIIMAEVAKLGK